MNKNIKEYTFSSDKKEIYSFEDMLTADLLANKFFKTEKDSTQLKINEENNKKIYNKFPDCQNIIKYKQKIIGETIVLPCTKQYMNKFIKDKINEAELFEYIIKNVNYENFECIYLCLMYILPEHQGKGLGEIALKKTIKILFKIKNNIEFFVRGFSPQGNHIANKISKLFKRPLLIKKH